MKATAQRRARIVRVRAVQHLQAAAAAGEAEAKVVALETNSARLADLRGSLAALAGPVNAATLAAASELAVRLDAARHGMKDGIAVARSQADAAAQARLEARIRQEGATKLEHRAVRALQDSIEQRLAASHRPRTGGRA